MIKQAGGKLTARVGGGDSVVGLYRIVIAGGIGLLGVLWQSSDQSIKNGQMQNRELITELRTDLTADIDRLQTDMNGLQRDVNALNVLATTNQVVLQAQQQQWEGVSQWRAVIEQELEAIQEQLRSDITGVPLSGIDYLLQFPAQNL